MHRMTLQPIVVPQRGETATSAGTLSEAWPALSVDLRDLSLLATLSLAVVWALRQVLA